MDKRLLILIGIALLSSAGFFAYRKIYYKPEGIKYTIKPRDVLKTGDSISFSDQTPGASRWKWDFGDGEYSADQSGYHTYLSAGKYDVSLTAYGPFGVQKKTETVTVIPNDILSQTVAPGISGGTTAKVGIPATWTSSVNAAGYEWKVEGDAALAGNKQKGNSATYTFKSGGQRTLVLTTHEPDAVLKRDIFVAAPEPIAKPVATNAPIQMPPQHSTSPAKPKPAVQHPHQQAKGNGLEDLGDGVEIKK
jgi:PKD repeat protein